MAGPRVGEGGLSAPGRARDADHVGPAGVRAKPREQLGQLRVAALDQDAGVPVPDGFGRASDGGSHDGLAERARLEKNPTERLRPHRRVDHDLGDRVERRDLRPGTWAEASEVGAHRRGWRRAVADDDEHGLRTLGGDPTGCLDEDREPLARRKLADIQHDRAIRQPEGLTGARPIGWRRRRRHRGWEVVDHLPLFRAHAAGMPVDIENARAHAEHAPRATHEPPLEPGVDVQDGQGDADPRAPPAPRADVEIEEEPGALTLELAERAVRGDVPMTEQARRDRADEPEVSQTQDHRQPEPPSGERGAHERVLFLRMDQLGANLPRGPDQGEREQQMEQRVHMIAYRSERRAGSQLPPEREPHDRDPVDRLPGGRAVVGRHDDDLVSPTVEGSGQQAHAPGRPARHERLVILGGEHHSHRASHTTKKPASSCGYRRASRRRTVVRRR